MGFIKIPVYVRCVMMRLSRLACHCLPYSRTNPLIFKGGRRQRWIRHSPVGQNVILLQVQEKLGKESDCHRDADNKRRTDHRKVGTEMTKKRKWRNQIWRKLVDFTSYKVVKNNLDRSLTPGSLSEGHRSCYTTVRMPGHLNVMRLFRDLLHSSKWTNFSEIFSLLAKFLCGLTKWLRGPDLARGP